MALAVAVVAAALAGGLALAWLRMKDRIIDSPEYRLDPQLVEITPPPEWIRADIRADVFRDPSLDGPLSILDADLAERIARAFARHPWVAKVVRVRPLHPASARVELEYRRPACMVETPGGLLPVDVEGYVLPEGDFTPGEKARFPRLIGVDRIPAVPPGGRWPDARIVGGAEIAAAIGPAWTPMRLQRIVPLESDPAAAAAGRIVAGRPVEPFFALQTLGGRRILWGYAPGAGAAGELPPEEKVARLKRFLTDHDSLNNRGEQQPDLDVRTMPPSTDR